ncbi:MAG: ABC transporter permease [Angustibacter sp.]
MAIVSAAQPPSGGAAAGPGATGPTTASPVGRRRLTPYLLLLPGLLWLGVFFLVPLLTLAGTSTQTPVVDGEIGAYEQTLRFANYWDALQEYAPQFGRSFGYAFIATVLTLAIGYPLAYAIAFKAGRWRNLLLVLVVAPFFCSFILRTIAWRQILSDEGAIVRTLKSVGLLGETTTLTASAVAVVAGITYNFLPFMTLPLYASLERIDPRLLEAGADLYGNPITVLRKVTVPLSMPGVVAGTLLTFIPAAGDYVNSALLGNPRTSMIGNVVQSRFLNVVDYPTAAVLSFLLMAAILVLVAWYVRRAGTEELV